MGNPTDASLHGPSPQEQGAGDTWNTPVDRYYVSVELDDGRALRAPQPTDYAARRFFRATLDIFGPRVVWFGLEVNDGPKEENATTG